MASSKKKKPQKDPLLWVVESIMEEPSYIDKAMFGCRGIYLHGSETVIVKFIGSDLTVVTP